MYYEIRIVCGVDTNEPNRASARNRCDVSMRETKVSLSRRKLRSRKSMSDALGRKEVSCLADECGGMRKFPLGMLPQALSTKWPGFLLCRSNSDYICVRVLSDKDACAITERG